MIFSSQQSETAVALVSKCCKPGSVSAGAWTVQLAAVLVLEDEGFEGVAEVGGHQPAHTKPSAARRSRPRWSSTRYWITWSARSSTDCGIVRPSAFAVLSRVEDWRVTP